jgi:hypothetical protein
MPHPQERLSPQLDYEGWRDLLRSMCGRYYSEGIEPISFSGWVRPINVRGFTALDIGSNAQRVERTYQMFAATARTTTSRCFSPVAS